MRGRDPHHPITLAATGAYTTDDFQIGLGGCALIAEDGPCFMQLVPAPGGTNSVAVCEENTGFTINQKLRLGALDGFSLTWRSSVFSRPDRFFFGAGRGAIAVPLTSRLGLFGAGGGAENGWGFGELGVRTYLGGTGASGTMIGPIEQSSPLGGVDAAWSWASLGVGDTRLARIFRRTPTEPWGLGPC